MHAPVAIASEEPVTISPLQEPHKQRNNPCGRLRSTTSHDSLAVTNAQVLLSVYTPCPSPQCRRTAGQGSLRVTCYQPTTNRPPRIQRRRTSLRNHLQDPGSYRATILRGGGPAPVAPNTLIPRSLSPATTLSSVGRVCSGPWVLNHVPISNYLIFSR